MSQTATAATMRKHRRRVQRKERVAQREKRWIERYEANQQKALGDENYRLPEGPVSV